MTINYEKLKLAHELAEKCGSEIYYSYTNKEGAHIVWVNLDQLLFEMKIFTRPEPKFKVGQEVFYQVNGHIYNQINKYIDFNPEDNQHSYDCVLESHIYPSRETLIEAQIEYWTCLLNEENSTHSDDMSKVSTECQHELEDNGYRGKYPITKCKRCNDNGWIQEVTPSGKFTDAERCLYCDKGEID